MPLLDNTRRWMRDQMTQDENIRGTPKEQIGRLTEALAQLTPEERQRNLEHLKAYTDYYYVGHHREQVPTEIRQQINAINKESERFNVVDQAREVLQKYGGPPTRETIENSLERSAQQREQQFARDYGDSRQLSHSPAVEMSAPTIAQHQPTIEAVHVRTIEKQTPEIEQDFGMSM